jgi:hypothetical protein
MRPIGHPVSGLFYSTQFAQRASHLAAMGSAPGDCPNATRKNSFL